MSTYLLIRTVGTISEEELEAAFDRGIQAADRMPEVRWVRSYYSAEEGKIYCEYEAPSAEALFEHARMAEIPLDRCTVVQNLEPSMFR
jgi:flavin-binding protein dodecin